MYMRMHIHAHINIPNIGLSLINWSYYGNRISTKTAITVCTLIYYEFCNPHTTIQCSLPICKVTVLSFFSPLKKKYYGQEENSFNHLTHILDTMLLDQYKTCYTSFSWKSRTTETATFSQYI